MTNLSVVGRFSLHIIIEVHRELPQMQTSKQSRHAVPWKNDHTFLILSGISGVVGLHVSCICISVYFSLQQGPSTQTIKFRI